MFGYYSNVKNTMDIGIQPESLTSSLLFFFRVDIFDKMLYIYLREYATFFTISVQLLFIQLYDIIHTFFSIKSYPV